MTAPTVIESPPPSIIDPILFARGKPEDQQQPGADLDQDDDPLEESPVGQHDVVDERLEPRHLRPLRRALTDPSLIDLEVEDAARPLTGDQIRVIRPDVDPRQRRLQLGQPIGEQDDAEEDADDSHPFGKEDRIDHGR